MAKSDRPRVVVAVTTRDSLLLMKGVLSRWKAEGFDPVFICGNPPAFVGEGVEVIKVDMARTISPLRDLRSVLQLRHILKRIKPVMVDASTPKAGLLVTVAAWLTRVPVRLYTLRGLPMETARGLRWMLYRYAERVAARCATHMICISASLRESAVAKSLFAESKAEVVGQGSSNGIDTEHFDPERVDAAAVDALRRRANLGHDVFIFGYIGRFNRDKGIEDLCVAWDSIRACDPRTRLLLVGPEELKEPELKAIFEKLHRDDRVAWIGPVEDVRPCYSLFDAFLFPSHREGFGNVLIEAAAMGVPSVSYDVTGCRDALADGVSGLHVPPRDPEAFAAAALKLAQDNVTAAGLRQTARPWVVEHFERQRHQDRLFARYRQWISEAKQ